jgi:foldase protein PrsA
MKSPQLAAALLAASLFAAGVSGARAATPDATFVAVNGQPITQADFDAQLARGPKAQAVLQNLVQQMLLDQYAQTNAIVVTDADISAKEDALKATTGGVSWEDTLRTHDLTEAGVRASLREQIIVERALAAQAPVTDADVSAYFDKNRTLFAPSATLAEVQARIKDTLVEQKEAPLVAGLMQTITSKATVVAGSTPDAPPATVNGVAIDRGQFDADLEADPAARTMLEQMVQAMLIEQYAKSSGMVIADKEISEREAALMASHPNGQWTQMLASQGLTEADVRELLRQQIIVDRALQSHVHVTPALIAQYFSKNSALFQTADQAQARHILVADLPVANKIEAQLKQGGNFADLARQYSIDPGSKDKGGELGWFPRGEMVPVFDHVAFTAPVGSISAPVQSQFGYHIIQVEGRKLGTKPTLAANRDRIRLILGQQQEQPFIQPFLQSLWKKATIVSNDPRFANLGQ